MSALTYAAAQILRVLPRQKITRVMGKLADHRWSPPVERAVVGLYSRFYNVDFDECTQRSGYANFDEFFTRTLRPGARPVDPAREAIVSPADGRIDSMGPVHPDASFFVKGRPYRVAELLGDEEEARRYVGGTGCVIYLSPRDYHRVHAPLEARIVAYDYVPGALWPVNPKVASRRDKLFTRNERVVIWLESARVGTFALVMIAASGVGNIELAHAGILRSRGERRRVELDEDVRRGDELGAFRLGSTVVVVLPPGAARVAAREGQVVRFGERIGELV